jgi:hypothetical protein
MTEYAITIGEGIPRRNGVLVEMTSIEARTAAAEAANVLGIQGVLAVLIEHASELLDVAAEQNDKLARARAASDHRILVNLKEKVHN